MPEAGEIVRKTMAHRVDYVGFIEIFNEYAREYELGNTFWGNVEKLDKILRAKDAEKPMNYILDESNLAEDVLIRTIEEHLAKLCAMHNNWIGPRDSKLGLAVALGTIASIYDGSLCQLGGYKMIKR
jgi:hypothetical protein